MAKVLVIDDDPSLLRALRLGLQAGGHEVVTAVNGEQGISQTALTSPDIVVLDLGLPDIDGQAVCKRIRQWSEVPIIILSASGTEDRKVAALDGGADDYVTKPFGMAELEARIRTALRHRKSDADEPSPASITIGSLDLDLVHHEAHVRGGAVDLTAKEFDVLSFLARHSGQDVHPPDDPGRGVGDGLRTGGPVPPCLRAPAAAEAGRRIGHADPDHPRRRLQPQPRPGTDRVTVVVDRTDAVSRTGEQNTRRTLCMSDVIRRQRPACARRRARAGATAPRGSNRRVRRRSTVARGKLRLYLGAAPGVGKTYAMLNEGWRRKERGTDVVIGWVQDHGRPHTDAQIRDLEIFPRRTVEYRGQTLEEMDIEGLLARRPELVLVDELAHTNAPGSKHAKRWQDVEELLDAGINVISTINLQHLESLNDVVEGITGVVQHETVPDPVVRAADQLELVDMAPEALRRRLAHGNVYPPERIDAALANYFRTGNLTALRELALLWVADRVDEELNDYRERHNIAGPWETKERVVVSLTGSRGQHRAHPACRPDGHADQGRARRGTRPHRRQPDRTRFARSGHQPRPARRPGRALRRSGGRRRGPGPRPGGQGGERHPAGDGSHPPEPVERVPPRLGHQLGHPGRRRLTGRARHRHRRGDACRLSSGRGGRPRAPRRGAPGDARAVEEGTAAPAEPALATFGAASSGRAS